MQLPVLIVTKLRHKPVNALQTMGNVDVNLHSCDFYDII